MFFHIDEDAYQKLSRYFEAIRRSLSKSSGQEEIIKDIEMRVSELLNEKQKSEKHVVGLKDVDEVIAVMGQPEDYIIDEENSAQSFNSYAARPTKKLYRDKEKGFIGGVATGLGHYFGIDSVWFKIMFLIFVFAGFGTGILAYIILWIVTPEAVTTSEKLEMTGEPVTIANIEKKVREEFDNVSDKFKNADYDKMGTQVKSGAQKIGNSLSDFIVTVFKIFSKILGVILIMTGLSVLVSLFIGVFTLGSSAFIDFPWQDFIEAGKFADYPVWSFGLLMFFAVGIPFFFLAVLGFKLLSPSIGSIGNIAKYSLLALWLISVSILISIGVQTASQVAYDGKKVEKQTLALGANDTLAIKFKYNDYYTKDIEEHTDFQIVQDSSNNKVIYSNNVSLRVMFTDEKSPYIQVEKTAKGKSFQEAKNRAEKIQYHLKFENNTLYLDNYFVTDVKSKFRDQEIELYLYLPEGTYIKPDASVQNYDESDNSFFNLHYSSDNYIYKVTNSQVKCLNCPADENEWDDIDDNDSVNVNINENGISIKKDTLIKSGKDFKELRINKDGIIIKTN